MSFISVAADYFVPAQRWSAVDAMFAELLAAAGLSASYVPVEKFYFNPGRRWADVQKMLDALAPDNPVPVSPVGFVPAQRWAAMNAMLQNIYDRGIATGPALASGTLPSARNGTAYSQAVSITGGVAPYTLAAITGLPPTLTAVISGGTIVFSGTEQ